MRGVAVATSSALAADAASEIAAQGGNAVDCALAASLIAMNTQPGVCSLAGGAYITIWRNNESPVTIDGGIAVPGQGFAGVPDDGVAVHMDYGGGVETVVGCASVGVPGALAACARAWERYGALAWRDLFEPVVRAASDGFPLPAASYYYLEYSGRSIFCRSPDGEHALYSNGTLRAAGTKIVVPHLANTLAEIARDGAATMYTGRLADIICRHVQAGGGNLTADDLAHYEPVERAALEIRLGDWSLAVNPPPAIGGAVLASLLLAARDGSDPDAVTDAELAALFARTQHAALAYRRRVLDCSEYPDKDARRMLELARDGQLLPPGTSSATVHTSAVDTDGLACAITSSSGYGSGEMPAGTGLWLNNCLGELELNRRGLDAGPPGRRLPSNMAPGVARREGGVLAFGSPGADRITTALQQVLLRHLWLGAPLAAAVDAPRLHVEVDRPSPRVSAEAGVNDAGLDYDLRRYPQQNMYFGGVAIARLDDTELDAAADPRRAGGIYVTGE